MLLSSHLNLAIAMDSRKSRRHLSITLQCQDASTWSLQRSSGSYVSIKNNNNKKVQDYSHYARVLSWLG